jgi:hypothetical protein
MSEKTIKEVVEIKDHPLENFFNIEPNTTEVVKLEQETKLVEVEDYDVKDVEIESDLQDIADKAISGYENLQEQIEDIDPKYAARSHEVANQLLNTALQAISQKADLKKHKDKLKIAKKKEGEGGKTVNNTVIMDTNTLIKHLKQGNKSNAIDVAVIPTESTEVKHDDPK